MALLYRKHITVDIVIVVDYIDRMLEELGYTNNTLDVIDCVVDLLDLFLVSATRVNTYGSYDKMTATMFASSLVKQGRTPQLITSRHRQMIVSAVHRFYSGWMTMSYISFIEDYRLIYPTLKITGTID